MLGENHPGRIRLNPDACVRARKRRGLSRAALVDLAEPSFPISEATVKRAEKGRAINLEKASTLATLLEVPLETLMIEPEIPRRSIADGPDRPGHAPFVGRAGALDVLHGALDRARAGRPQVVLLRADAGVGKSRLLREWRSLVGSHLIRFGLGHCTAHTGRPFEPFIDALAALGDAVDELPPEERVVLQRALHPTEAAPEPLSGERDLALFRAVAKVVSVDTRPVVLALEDLQWIDPASLELLQYVVLSGAHAADTGEASRLVVVLSYRDDEIPAGVAHALRRFDAEDVTVPLELSPLDSAQTFELLVHLGVERPAQQLVAAVFDATNGNPLLVQEALRWLRAEGALEEVAGFTTTTLRSRDLELPATLASAIATRVAGLAKDARRALVRGAFLGMRFDLPKLAVVLQESEDDVLELLEEAVGEGFLSNRGQDFEFAHPAMRQAFYQEPIDARAQRIHREIAERLEDSHGARADEAAREIATHLILAGPVALPERTMHFARIAAKQAAARFAWEDSANFTQAVAEIGKESGGLSDADIGALHWQTGVWLHRCWDVGPAIDHYDAAINALERAGDLAGFAGALNDRVRLADNVGRDSSPLDRARIERLEAVLSRVDDRCLRGRILDTLATCVVGHGDTEAAEAMGQEALAIGLDEGDDDLCAQVSTALALARLQRLELEAAVHRWEQGRTFARRAGEQLRELRCLQRLPVPLVMLGRFDEARRVADEAWEMSGALQNSGESSLTRTMQSSLGLLRGDFSMATKLGRETLGIVRRRRYVWSGPLLLPVLVRTEMLRGELGDARAWISEVLRPGLVFDDPQRFAGAARRLRWMVDAVDSAVDMPSLREEVRREALDRELPPHLDLAATTRLAVEVDLAVAIGLPALASRAYEPLLQARANGARVVPGWCSLVERSLALSATARGEWDLANDHFGAAMSAAEALNAEPERALVCLGWAGAIEARPGGAGRERPRGLVRTALGLADKLAMPRVFEEATRLERDLG